MKQDERVAFDVALEHARVAAYPDGQYVGQESFMTAREIRSLALQAEIGPRSSVLDLCCGVGGPGRFITRELGCIYRGVDSSASAIALAHERTTDTRCRFEVAEVPPVPAEEFDVVLLLETLLAFQDKETLFEGVAAALPPGGRFAFTIEEGPPLTAAERATMPDADTVWLVPMSELLALVDRAGMELVWLADCSQTHRVTAEALTTAYLADRAAIGARIGRRATDELIAAHGLWSDWLASGRVRKFAVVAQKVG